MSKISSVVKFWLVSILNLCTPQANSCMQISFIDSYCDSFYVVSVGGRLYWGCRPTSRGVFCLSCLICASRLSSPCRRQKRRGGPIRAPEWLWPVTTLELWRSSELEWPGWVYGNLCLIGTPGLSELAITSYAGEKSRYRPPSPRFSRTSRPFYLIERFRYCIYY